MRGLFHMHEKLEVSLSEFLEQHEDNVCLMYLGFFSEVVYCPVIDKHCRIDKPASTSIGIPFPVTESQGEVSIFVLYGLNMWFPVFIVVLLFNPHIFEDPSATPRLVANVYRLGYFVATHDNSLTRINPPC